MIADKDERGNISIMEIPPDVNEYLVDALYHYFCEQPVQCRTDQERQLILLMHQLENFQDKPKSNGNKL